jgi:L-asparaginase / beta-aspartyl-peptidase
VSRTPWSLAVHGGAGGRPEEGSRAELDGVRRTLEQALEAGRAVLAAAGRSLDAVQGAVSIMERSGLLNAGRGSVLNEAGRVEVDAAIMDGAHRSAGAVAAVRHVPNPIDLAREVLEDGRHVLLVGEGAERFARARGLELCADGELASERRLRELEAVQHARGPVSIPWHPRGTVGAVALDVHGALAAATSTGGLTNKLPGRVGDSPILGAGTLADNGVCAVSATGAGEYFLRYTAASEVHARMKYLRESVEAASRAVIAEIEAGGGRGGLIAIDRNGELAMPFSTQTMLRGWVSATQCAQVIVDA